MMFDPLQPGARIALVAPSSPFDEEKLDQARILLQDAGYRPSTGEHAFRRKGYLAGTEAERATDLIRSLSDPDIAAVLCIRGGYGSGRLLPWLPFSTLRQSPKIFLGYSDITFLHLAFYARMGWCTFHGPNLTDMADAPEKAEDVLKTLRGENDFSWELADDQVLRSGVASGILFGGNLTCMAHLLGTPYFPDLDGAILMIEDRGETLYRLDRLLTQLKQTGVLERLAGLVVGQFTECAELDAIHEMIMDQVEPYHFPVISNLPFGHGPCNRMIPLGIPFSLSTHERSFSCVGSPFGK